jgi:hypothetical protein
MIQRWAWKRDSFGCGLFPLRFVLTALEPQDPFLVEHGRALADRITIELRNPP